MCRLTLAPGFAIAWDFYVGSVRTHARYLQPVNDPMATGAVELGVGASTRINWAPDFWGGSWPLEAWLDYRYRRGTGINSDAREHEVRGGLDYTTPTASIDRIGVELAGTGDRLADGTEVHGLAMMLSLQLRGGS